MTWEGQELDDAVDIQTESLVTTNPKAIGDMSRDLDEVGTIPDSDCTIEGKVDLDPGGDFGIVFVGGVADLNVNPSDVSQELGNAMRIWNGRNWP